MDYTPKELIDLIDDNYRDLFYLREHEPEEAQKRALELSIDKWKILCTKLRDGEYVYDGGAETCACCVLYRLNSKEPCMGCPVAEDTGNAWCRGTPYDAWHEKQEGLVANVEIEDLLEAAEKELNYLQNLYEGLS